MIRRWLPHVLLSIGIVLGIVLAWRTKVFSKNVLMLDMFACTCPDYRVVQGTWKISSPLLDTIAYLDKSEVYVTGTENPYSDPMTAYDFMLAEGEVVGVDRVSEGDPWNPVIHVTRWEHLGIWMDMGYGMLKWGAILFPALGLWMLWAQRTGY
ncbi:MAG: hypothetical protein KF797_13400 [Flavobacteriales bacterium]|nr:hypothetical protein [Flavobacteriales bacterium]